MIERTPKSSPEPDKPDSTPTQASEAFFARGDTVPYDAPRGDGPGLERIGPYQIQDRIGEGGMGVVYKAVQDRPHRTVALKLVKLATAGAEAYQRFEREAEFLGRLQHPGIARVYEAGTEKTPHGIIPFYAMEWIQGAPLTSYCEEQELDTKRRLELLIQVCDAVQHAHQRGIIHRDLKPDNILVDESGAPKVLDFGIARTADPEEASLQTSTGRLVGTLPYMSPEQVSGDRDQIDLRTDVYALGVIAYQVLTGKLPYDLAGRSLPEAVRIIGEETPPALSSTSRVYRGDVDTIVGKALAKEKERRYATVAALAEDFQRFLEDRPIVARPPSAMYELRKFVRRNRVLVASIVGIVLTGAVLGFVLVQQHYQHKIEILGKEQEQQQAERKRELQVTYEGHCASARELIYVGKWQPALDALKQAAATSDLDPEALLMRLHALAALNRPQEARQTFDQLSGRAQELEYPGQVMLWEVDLDRSAWTRPRETRSVVERAIEAGLPPADLAYARGMVSSSFAEVIDHLEDSVTAQPTHIRARYQLLIHLFLTGQKDRTEEHLTVLSMLLSEDPNFQVFVAIDHALKGRNAAALETLDRVAEALGPKSMSILRRWITELGGWVAESAWHSGQVRDFALAIRKLVSAMGAMAEVTDTMTLPPLMSKVTSGALAFAVPIIFQKYETASEKVSELQEVISSGILDHIQGMLHMNLDNKWESYQWFDRAVDAPSLFPVRPASLHMKALMGIQLIIEDDEKWRSQLGPEILGAVETIVDEKVLSKSNAYAIVKFTLSLGDHELARQVHRQWREKDPGNGGLPLYDAMIDYRAGAQLRAKRTLEAFLEKNPDQQEAIELLEKIEKQLAPTD